jgi:major vault protein
MSTKVFSIAPFQYLHVLNKNDNTKRLICGPINFAIEDHEEIVSKVPEKMIIIPNLHYVSIRDPIEKDKDGNILKDRFGLNKYRWNMVEIRTRENYSEPFPLYPEEKLHINATPLSYVDSNEALHLKCIINFNDGEFKRYAGEEWLFVGPGHFIPRQELQIVKRITEVIIQKNQALKLRANRNLKDSYGILRKAGEEWLIRQEGGYLPQVGEDQVETVKAVVLDDKTALHLQAISNFTDYYNIKRKAGEEWLVTSEIANHHICDVYEKILEIQKMIVVSPDEYCVILNPYDINARKNKLGKVELIKGIANFFLNPGEKLEGGAVQKINILTEGESILLQAKENFYDEATGKNYKAGEKWIIDGPLRFIPPVEVKIISTRRIIPLDKNEGIYIRNVKTGKVFKHMGSSYSLKPEEVLWEKELPETVEKIYMRDLNMAKRDKTRIVAYKCPFNSIMQIYNMKEKSNRIVFGPNLAILDPDEEFTLMSLSGKTPKVQNVVQTLYLKLGPIFSTDEFDVETVDHTRLRLRLSYNWIFDLDKNNVEEALKIFTIRDFIGEMCLTMASRIRSSIASLLFDDFHKNSEPLIKKAIFGHDYKKGANRLRYEGCCLYVTDVDIQSVTPTDQTTMNLLQKSVSLAIELTTKTIEQQYQINLLIKDQEFKGQLEKLKIDKDIELLKEQLGLSKLRCDSRIIETAGLSRAQALAYKDANSIESKSLVKLSELTKRANEIEAEFEVNQKKKQNESNFYFLLF